MYGKVMIKNIVLVISFCSVAVATFFGYEVYRSLGSLTLHNANHNSLDNNNILIVSTDEGSGGTCSHVIALLTGLQQKRINAIGLFEKKSCFIAQADKKKLQYFSINTSPLIRHCNGLYKLYLGFVFSELYNAFPFAIIHTNNSHEVAAAQKITRQLPVATAFTKHVDSPFPARYKKVFSNLDAFICVSPFLTADIKEKNHDWHMGIKHMLTIPPLFNTDHLRTAIPFQNRTEFYKEAFGLEVKPNEPVLCMVGNFYKLLAHKNHPLLLEAVSLLVNQHKIPVHVMLAGNGEMMSYIQKLTVEKKLTNYVHFLGFTPKINALLAHSDVFVLASSRENFAIALMEAGLMSKPSIAATKTGAEALIVHEKTGLLFENNNAQDLAKQIKRCIDNPSWAADLGKKAFIEINEKFHPALSLERHIALYKELIKTNRMQA
jgi:glycosyltransferase involved in cell wall biosynthesis